jgi:hypothetical protein
MTSFVRLQDTIVRVDRIFKVFRYELSSGTGEKWWKICIFLTDDGKSKDYQPQAVGSYTTAEERDKDFDRIANELTQNTSKVELQRAPVSTFGPTSSSGADKGFFVENQNVK